MQVSAISSNQGFTGKRHSRENIDRVIYLNDNQLRAMAYVKTLEKDQQRQKRVNRLFNAVPLVGALSAGILTKGNATEFSQEVSGLAAKTTNSLKSGGYWAFLLGTAAAIGAGTRAISRNSEKASEFKQKHPLLTLGAQIAALFAAITYLPKGASKLYNMIKPEYIAKAGDSAKNIAGHINRIKTPEFLKNLGEKISEHTPEMVKNIGKTIVAYAPDITLVTAALASLKAYVGGAQDFSNTYLSLKEKQHQLAQARLNELNKID